VAKQSNVKNLVLALFQSNLHWQDRAANLAMFEEKIWQLDRKVDVLVLPEMFTTGFTMEVTAQAEPMNLHATKWMQQMAAQTNAAITGSVIIKENGKFFNRLLWVTPDGEVRHYDKRHLFRMAREDDYYDMGEGRLIIDFRGWKIMPQICYDLRFPVWSRNRASQEGQMEYDLLFYIASWPAPRVQAWDVLLKARAVENLCYIAGVNRIEEDGNGIPYCGHSGAYDFKGETLAFGGEEEKTMVVELDKAALEAYRKKFPAWKDADRFELG
jgi:predicted amidohydrolase